jgi:hypothetical protein
MSRMTYMRSCKSHRLTSHNTWLGRNPQIGRPLSRIVGAIGLFFIFLISSAEARSCVCLLKKVPLVCSFARRTIASNMTLQIFLWQTGNRWVEQIRLMNRCYV